MLNSLDKIFRGKVVLLTGHTGFKGTWLTIWLNQLGAKVVGVSDLIPTIPSHFESSKISDKIVDQRLDIRNYKNLESVLLQTQPDYVFHLAAQPIVRLSYQETLLTWETNTLGTINLLESLKKLDNKCIAIFITSDKCYDNKEWVWGYKETDSLGGIDPYSGSKGAAELAIRSYSKSFFNEGISNIKIGIGRAGNVIGGGDWANDRIVPDCVRAWSNDNVVQLRNPNATRPWQHVLEPLSGYLNLALALDNGEIESGEAFNFGPPSSQNHSVLDLVKQMSLHWDKVKWEDLSSPENQLYESSLLKLNCDKALHLLNWRSVWNFSTTVQKTTEWYQKYYDNSQNSIIDFSILQINEYCNNAYNNNLKWSF